MTTRVAINGFGRIGRQVLRAAKLQQVADIEFVAVNDLADTRTLAHLFKYDSVHGTYQGDVCAKDGVITINGDEVKVLSENEPANLPWKDLGVDIVLESTGQFTDAGAASKHIDAGARKVIISAPANGEDITIVLGFNETAYDAQKHTIISNASCTTNCLVPMVTVVKDNFGFLRGSMVTVHSYTNDQTLLDVPHKDLRRARAAGVSIIPTTTGAVRATSRLIPGLREKLDGFSIRVPTADVSFTDLTVVVEKPVTVHGVNDAFRRAAESGPLQRYLKYTEEELVSCDFIGDPHSCIIDGTSTRVIDGTLLKVSAWYDNEWGYSSRCVDLLRYVGARL